MHLCLDNAGVGFTFLMDCAGRDRMALGGLLLNKMVENFATFIQSGDYVVLTNETIFCICIWLFSPPLGGQRLWTRITCSNV